MIARPEFRVIRQESASLNFASIATTAYEDLTISLPGAKINDLVLLGLPAAPFAGLAYMAFVSAADVVTVRAMNYTGTSKDAGAQTFSVAVAQLY